ncbi:hypothetical protein [Amycolatopsis sp. lyj-109]|uniref:hypothetical protein n=1 Tax=Amycolatopsis sp. lyj-109 TaxID=2789287 RepID=UPI00397A5341
MGTGAQVVVAALAVLVVLTRLAVALCQARTDARIAARRAREDRRLPAGQGPRSPTRREW